MDIMEAPKGKRRLKLKPTLKAYSDGAYKWAVYYQGSDGQRTRRKFCQKRDAAAFLADKEVEAENLGNRIASALGDDLKREAYDAQVLLKPYGKSLMDAARFYHAHLEATAKSETLEAAKTEFLAAMEKAGKSPRYIGDPRPSGCERAWGKVGAPFNGLPFSRFERQEVLLGNAFLDDVRIYISDEAFK